MLTMFLHLCKLSLDSAAEFLNTGVRAPNLAECIPYLFVWRAMLFECTVQIGIMLNFFSSIDAMLEDELPLFPYWTIWYRPLNWWNMLLIYHAASHGFDCYMFVKLAKYSPFSETVILWESWARYLTGNVVVKKKKEKKSPTLVFVKFKVKISHLSLIN